MKTEVVEFPKIDEEVTYYIGTSAKDNFAVIDEGDDDDIWFHANKISSCHVVCKMPEGLNKKDKTTVLKRGALLCKQHTAKLNKPATCDIMCAYIKDVEKTRTLGCVNVKNVIKNIKI